MIKKTHGFFVPAIVQGLFFAILSKTGIDLSPSGVGLTLLKAFEPIIPEQYTIHLPNLELILYFVPLLGFIAVYIHHGKYGLLAYFAIIIGSFLFFTSMWK